MTKKEEQEWCEQMRRKWGTSPEVHEMVEHYFDKPRIVISTRPGSTSKNQAKENDPQEDKV